MLAYLTQASIDAFVANREMRIAADLVDPMREFPGDVWCDGNWSDLKVSGFDFVDFTDLVDPAYLLPARQNVDAGVLAEAEKSSSRTCLQLSEADSTAMREATKTSSWSHHLAARRLTPAFFACLPPNSNSKESGVRSWSTLSRFRMPSSFAVVVDPYLYHNDSRPDRNLASLLSAAVAPPSVGDLHIVVLCKWERSSKHRPTERLVKEQAIPELEAAMRQKSFGGDLTISFIDADDKRLNLRGIRLHDRYVLTQHHTFTSGAGFSDPSSRKNFSEVVVQYHAGSQSFRQSFDHRLAEVASYLEACNQRRSADMTLPNTHFVLGGDHPGGLRKRLLERVLECMGDTSR